jgi:hypothetical protein
MSDDTRDAYADAVRGLTPEQKLRTAWSLRASAWELVAAGVRARHPELEETEVQERVRRVFLRAVT